MKEEGIMKTKTILTYQNEGQKLWYRRSSERRGVEFCLLAELPEDDEIFYASSIDSSIGKKHKLNHQSELRGIELLKEKGGGRFLKIKLENEKEIVLTHEMFVMVFITPDNDEKGNDNILLYSFPKLLGEKIFDCCFESDNETGNAVTLFWLLKEFF